MCVEYMCVCTCVRACVCVCVCVYSFSYVVFRVQASYFTSSWPHNDVLLKGHGNLLKPFKVPLFLFRGNCTSNLCVEIKNNKDLAWNKVWEACGDLDQVGIEPATGLDAIVYAWEIIYN